MEQFLRRNLDTEWAASQIPASWPKTRYGTYFLRIANEVPAARRSTGQAAEQNKGVRNLFQNPELDPDSFVLPLSTSSVIPFRAPSATACAPAGRRRAGRRRSRG